MILNRQAGYYSIKILDLFFEITEDNNEVTFIVMKKDEQIFELSHAHLIKLSGLEYPDLDKMMSVGIISFYQLINLK